MPLPEGVPPDGDWLPLLPEEGDWLPPDDPGMPPPGMLTEGPLAPPDVWTLELLQADTAKASTATAAADFGLGQGTTMVRKLRHIGK